MLFLRRCISFVVVLLLPVGDVVLAAPAAAEVPAFPGAEGFGSHTRGGRGGRVIAVTNLNADGPGSFRAAVKATGPRIVVFHVSGVIDLGRGLTVTEPFVTIAGQTAPGDGICLKNGGLTIRAHDVVMRHIRVRPGDGAGGMNPGNRDCLSIEGPSDQVYNVVIDHCSFSWATDENVTTWYGPRNVTIQWSISSESLRDSISPSGAHSFGMLFGSEGNTVSVHHCLLAHNWQRNPFISGDPKSGGAPSIIDFRNNVIYTNGHLPDARVRDVAWFNYVGNTTLFGQDGPHDVKPSSRPFGTSPNRHEQRLYLEDNVWPGQTEPDAGNWPEPIAVAPVTTQSASDALESVLRFAGATRPVRDVIDDRVVREVRSRTGGIVNSPSEVGGWPTYRSTPAPVDTDHDGMPDAWEKRHGFDPRDPADGAADADGDVYTNVEEYLNDTHPRKHTSGAAVAQAKPRVQGGNDALRFGVARQPPKPVAADPDARARFVEAVRMSGQDVAGYVGLTFVPLPPGRFSMPAPAEKSSAPEIPVELTRSFEIAVTEVTQAQWVKVMGSKPWLNGEYIVDAPAHPATYVSYDDAQEFLARLNAAGSGRYRLPTEAEWEWAWLAGAPRPGEEEMAGIAWHEDNTVDVGKTYAQAVAQREPNSRGLHDMLGNVHEWCHDYWDYWFWRRGDRKVDPTGGTEETKTYGYRVVRGGSFYMTPRQLNRSQATAHRPEYRGFDVGFRVVRDPAP